jgi:cyclase
LDAIEWVKRAVDLGAGEVLLTSVDMEGTRKGFDLELIRRIGPELGVPVIACGGAGSVEHVSQSLNAGADAVAVASLLHYKTETMASIKTGLRERGHEVRL